MHRVRLFFLSLVLAFVALPSVARAQRLEDTHAQARFTVPPQVQPDATQQGPEYKSPGTATLLSLLITGGGQFYNEETVKGVVMLGLGVVFTVLAIDGIDEYDCDPTETCYEWMLPVGLSGALATKIWSILDAGPGARRYNARRTGLVAPRDGPRAARVVLASLNF